MRKKKESVMTVAAASATTGVAMSTSGDRVIAGSSGPSHTATGRGTALARGPGGRRAARRRTATSASTTTRRSKPSSARSRSLLVVSTEARLFATMATAIHGLAESLPRLSPGARARAERAALRTIPGLGEVPPTTELNEALSALQESVERARLRAETSALREAHEQLEESVPRRRAARPGPQSPPRAEGSRTVASPTTRPRPGAPSPLARVG